MKKLKIRVNEILDKQIPLKPADISKTGRSIRYVCGRCESVVETTRVHNYCPVCGQCIDW